MTNYEGKTFAKHWTDQPDAVTEAEPLSRFFLSGPGQSVEVRQIGFNDGLFVTVGNLFGSQTIQVPDAKTAFQVIGAMADLENGQTIKISRFPGAEILDAEGQPV